MSKIKHYLKNSTDDQKEYEDPQEVRMIPEIAGVKSTMF